MKYVVAVSGGVDSVVLLDMLVQHHDHELIVAHFDHGIRKDAAADARFVGAVADYYQLPFETKREELGKTASEAVARNRRYAFLTEIARKHNGQIVTAHHQDDVVETIAINLTRGTGWRGLAAFGNQAIARPLVAMSKREIYEYALEKNLEWVEDETNQQQQYLRNRLRQALAKSSSSATTASVVERWKQQTKLRKKIDEASSQLLHDSGLLRRYFFIMIDDASADELLAAILCRQTMSLTRPQRRRLLHAIKTAPAGTTFEAGSGIVAVFTRREFIVKSSS